MGDSRIELLIPNGTSDAGWTSTAGTHWEAVSVITDPDATPTPLDVFADWIFTAVADTEVFAYDSISSDSIVRALSVEYLARRDDVQSRSVQSTVTAGSQTGTTRVLGTSWKWYQDVYPASDGASTAWTQDSIHNSGFGIDDVTP